MKLEEKCMVTLLLVLIIIAMVTLLSVQNATPVLLSLPYLKFEVSLAVIIVLSAVAGVIIGVIAASHFKKKVLMNQQPYFNREKEVPHENVDEIRY
jgi:uncharacterized integral membrane protein